MTRYEVLRAARDSKRITGRAAAAYIVTDFIEMHGDRLYGDDGAIVGGIGLLGQQPVTVICHEKGQDLAERKVRNFGMAHPEGYRKALRLMKQAEKFNRPVLCLIDTAGAFCGIGAEERGQGSAIADNLREMMALQTPIISVLLGEGGSGGALALAVADTVWMMENSIYSVISPEGCSSILWKNPARVKDACEALKITPTDLLELGVIQRIMPEYRTPKQTYTHLQGELAKAFAQLGTVSTDTLLQNRYQLFRNMGDCRLP